MSTMEKVWFIWIDGTREGPYSVRDLKRHPRITPDTLVWKAGFAQWVPLRKVAELKPVFEDEKKPEPDEEKPKKVGVTIKPQEETLALRFEPPLFYFWLLIAALILVYTLYQLRLIS